MEFPDTNSAQFTANSMDSNSVSVVSKKEFVDYDLYSGNLLHFENNSIDQSTVLNNDWIVFVLLVVFAIITWVRVYHIKRFWQLLQAFVSSLQVDHILRENDRLMSSVLFSFNAVFYLITSAFVYIVILYFKVEQNIDLLLHPYVLILFVIIGIYQFKSWFIKILGILFLETELADKYKFNVLLMNKILGLLLLPIVVLLSFLKIGGLYLILIGSIFVIALYILRIRRGLIIISNNTNLSYFHLFLYLCALEILPLSVLVRICYDGI